MTAAIAYDRPVVNYIDELSATGHVTHNAYRKKSVTLHHNGGCLSHYGVLSVWQTRPASAHFDVDGKGAVAQYVRPNEYAWAVGDYQGNMETISIEMANADTGGIWPVAGVTWRSAARLAGWLFAKVIGERPSKSNLFYHHKWSSTACAGPYMDTVYDLVLKDAQAAYDYFIGSPAASAKPPSGLTTKPRPVPATANRAPAFPLPDGWYFGPRSGPRQSVSGYAGRRAELMMFQRQLKVRGWSITVDGFYGDKTATIVKAFQKDKKLSVDGKIGPATWAAAWNSRIT